MPLIKLKHISSFSSEDTAQPSSNLLKAETYRKWRCAEPGEKQAVVVVELEKSTKIHSIDLGNNGSAFVEVLVGRSSDANDKFKVLLVASSFMTPADSKSFTNTNRVRMFGNEKLSKPVADEKWDKVKIVCTQPFNKNERYGLSFVSFHSPPEDSPSKKENDVQSKKRLGSFTLRDEEGDNIKPGSLFFQKKMTSPPPSASTAAQVRDAASSSSSSHSDFLKKSEVGGLLKSRQPVASKPREEKERKPAKQELKPFKQDKPALSVPSETSSKRKERADTKSNPPKSVSPPPKRVKKTGNVPFHQIMKGVVFVLSGFKNPERGDIRDKALEMGAQYKPDWMTGCTHLICAFANTPKYYQVKGKGKIVTKKWISDCHKKKRKLPTKNYHLPGDTSSSDGSDTEDESPSASPQSSSRGSSLDNSRNSKTKISYQDEETSSVKRTPELPSMQNNDDEKDPLEEDTDDEIAAEKDENDEKPKIADSDQDTDDELERLQDKKDDSDDDDIYNMSTEDEDKDNHLENGDSSGPDELPELPDFFSKKHFLLYGEMDQLTRRTLIRYITAYNGILEDYMTESVDFVITNEIWDQNFEDALSENASLAFIKPKWIIVCHEKSSMVPFQPYIITPS